MTRQCQILTRQEVTERLRPVVLLCTVTVTEGTLPPTDLRNTEVSNVPVYTCVENIILQWINSPSLHQIT